MVLVTAGLETPNSSAAALKFRFSATNLNVASPRRIFRLIVRSLSESVNPYAVPNNNRLVEDSPINSDHKGPFIKEPPPRQ
jgi:hypothetical protein